MHSSEGILIKMDFEWFNSRIQQAEKEIVFCAPGIQTKEALALIALRNTNSRLAIKVIIQISEDAIRNGFGSDKAIENLLKSGIEVLHVNDNFISFLLTDQHGYYIFPFSTMMIDDKKVKYNAARMDPQSVRIMKHLFLPKEKEPGQSDRAALEKLRAEFDSEISAAEKKEPVIEKFEKKKEEFTRIKESITNNPPLPPDLKRMIDTYNAEIQFVELSFEGGHLQSRTIHYPKKALPITSTELKAMLNSSMKMFSDLSSNPIFSKLNLLRIKVDKLRKDYLTTISCRPNKSVLSKKKKVAFQKQVSQLKTDIEKIKEELPSLLKKEKEKTEKLIEGELTKYFKRRMPAELKLIEDPTQRREMLNNYIQTIIEGIDFPNMSSLSDKMVLRCSLYDLTWDDFSDQQLLAEFKEKKILEKEKLDAIVRDSKAYLLQKTKETNG